MGDDDSKAIPSWQRRDSETSLPAPESADIEVIEPKLVPDSIPSEASPETREELISQAASWLEHPHIYDAPHEGKVSFLEGKGLTSEEIHKLLGDGGKPKQKNETQPDAPSTPESALSSTENNEEPLARSTVHADGVEAPPIITYPEFMLQAPSKPPLISRNTILNTLSATAAAAGALHVTSTYLVSPLLAELTAARHDLYSSTLTHLEKLNTALTGVISRVPPTASAISHSKTASGEDDDINSEISSSDDPSELFHRDIGVQTSRPTSPASSSSDFNLDQKTPQARLDAQAAKLSRLRAQLQGLSGAATDAAEAQREAVKEIGDLDVFLDSMRFGRRGGAKMVGGIPGLADGVGYLGGDTSLTGGMWDDGEDEVDRLKKEIRGVKGVLLSARSFPGVKSGTIQS